MFKTTPIYSIPWFNVGILSKYCKNFPFQMFFCCIIVIIHLICNQCDDSCTCVIKRTSYLGYVLVEIRFRDLAKLLDHHFSNLAKFLDILGIWPNP